MSQFCSRRRSAPWCLKGAGWTGSRGIFGCLEGSVIVGTFVVGHGDELIAVGTVLDAEMERVTAVGGDEDRDGDAGWEETVGTPDGGGDVARLVEEKIELDVAGDHGSSGWLMMSGKNHPEHVSFG